MTVDDLSAPLGREPKPQTRSIKIPVPRIIAGVLALFLGLFVLWAILVDDPFGGEPSVVVPADGHRMIAAKPSPLAGSHEAAVGTGGMLPSTNQGAAAPAATRTITIIDGKTGERREQQIPADIADSPSTDSTGKSSPR
jgi:uncharacterized protein